MSIRCLKFGAAFPMVLAASMAAEAGNYNDSAAGNWTAPATWGGGGYPASTADNATMDSHAVTLDAPVTINTLTLNNKAAQLNLGVDTLIAQGGFVFSAGELDGNGNVTVTNSSLTVSTADPGPTNKAVIDVFGGGSIACSATSRRLWNNGTIRLLGGTLRQTSTARDIFGTGVWQVAAGAVLKFENTQTAWIVGGWPPYTFGGYPSEGIFNNDGLVLSSNALWGFGRSATAKGTHTGSFQGYGFAFFAVDTFRSNSSVNADNEVSVYEAVFEPGSSLVTSNLSVRLGGTLTLDIPATVQSFGRSAAGFGQYTVKGNGPLTCLGDFRFPGGELDTGGAITTATLTVSLDFVNGNTNARTITVLSGGTFSSSAGGRILVNVGRIELLGGQFAVNSSKSDLFRGDGILFVGPSGTLHRIGGTSSLTHENPTTNAGTIKVSTGILNFTGGMTQTATGALMGNGGALNGTLAIDGGEIAPGSNAGEAGALTLSGTVNMSSESKMTIELGGTTATNEYDRLHGGIINLSGCGLEVTFINGFKNSVDNADIFTVIKGTLNGAFGNLSGGRVAASDGSGTFLVTVTTGVNGSVVLTDFQAAAPPGTLMLIR